MSANSAFAISGCGPWPCTCGSRSPAISDASISSGTFSGSGAMADRMSAGGPPRNTVAGSALAAPLGDGVVDSRRPCRSASACRWCARRSTCMRYIPRLCPALSGCVV